MDVTTRIEDVRTFQTARGNARYVVRDAEGKEYTTFRPAIGRRAEEFRGQSVRIEYHEEQRGDFRNVYLDGVEPVPDSSTPQGESTGESTGAEEEAWRTAVDAAPWLVGESEPHSKVDPDELYETLKPFKDKVAEDIRESQDE
jgi:hypothetical protein